MAAGEPILVGEDLATAALFYQVPAFDQERVEVSTPRGIEAQLRLHVRRVDRGEEAHRLDGGVLGAGPVVDRARAAEARAEQRDLCQAARLGSGGGSGNVLGVVVETR